VISFLVNDLIRRSIGSSFLQEKTKGKATNPIKIELLMEDLVFGMFGFELDSNSKLIKN
jgi:hypothetical protein